jgi:hypothetical protein
LEQDCATLFATGWAWAKPKAAMPQGWHYNGAWDRLPQPDKKKLPPIIVKELKAIEAAEHADPDDAESMRDSILSLAMATLYSDADKAKTGCVLEVDQHGRLMITAGVSERKAKAAAKPKAKAKDKAAAPAEAKEAAISAKLALTLSQELTQAAADTLRDCKDPFLVVKMVTAALITTYGGPLKVKTEGMLTPQMSEVEAFDEAWVRLAKYKTMEEMITTSPRPRELSRSPRSRKWPSKCQKATRKPRSRRWRPTGPRNLAGCRRRCGRTAMRLDRPRRPRSPPRRPRPRKAVKSERRDCVSLGLA